MHHDLGRDTERPSGIGNGDGVVSGTDGRNAFFPFHVIPGEDVVHSTPGLEAARALQEFKLEMEFATGHMFVHPVVLPMVQWGAVDIRLNPLCC